MTEIYDAGPCVFSQAEIDLAELIAGPAVAGLSQVNGGKSGTRNDSTPDAGGETAGAMVSRRSFSSAAIC